MKGVKEHSPLLPLRYCSTNGQVCKEGDSNCQLCSRVCSWIIYVTIHVSFKFRHQFSLITLTSTTINHLSNYLHLGLLLFMWYGLTDGGPCRPLDKLCRIGIMDVLSWAQQNTLKLLQINHVYFMYVVPYSNNSDKISKRTFLVDRRRTFCHLPISYSLSGSLQIICDIVEPCVFIIEESLTQKKRYLPKKIFAKRSASRIWHSSVIANGFSL